MGQSGQGGLDRRLPGLPSSQADEPGHRGGPQLHPLAFGEAKARWALELGGGGPGLVQRGAGDALPAAPVARDRPGREAGHAEPA
eukprot:2565902-Alexandrium_andersonii.AAC.1